MNSDEIRNCRRTAISPTRVEKDVWRTGAGKRESSAPQRGKGQGKQAPSRSNSWWRQPDPAHARTSETKRNETKRFLGWTHPRTTTRVPQGVG